MTIVLDQVVSWGDERLVINKNNSFWRANKSYAMITGTFVNECMWTPKMMFLNVIPTPKFQKGSPLSFYLFRNGTVMAHRKYSRLTFSCGMEFSNFPFDIQVCYA